MPKNRKPKRGAKRVASKARLGDLVVVDWVDSCSNSGWRTKDEAAFPVSECRTVGWLLKRTNEKICLHGEESDLDAVGMRETIPAGCVRRIRVVRGFKSRW